MEVERLERGAFMGLVLVLFYLAWLLFNLNTDDLINSSLMSLLCIGFTFTYMMEGFPNLAHTSYAVMGAVVTFYLTRFHRYNPYDTWGFSILAGGFLGIIIYVSIVRRIRTRSRGYQMVTLTFCSLAISTVLNGLSHIFSYWSSRSNAPTSSYNLSYMDFWFQGKPGIVYVGVGLCIVVAFYLYFFLTRTKTGISLRALAEDEGLAEVMGINSFRMHCLAWFISGGLAALAGSIIVIHQGMTPEGVDGILVNVMTGSILGGLNNIPGAIIGGVFIGVTHKVLSTLLFWVFGLNSLKWANIYSIAFLVLTLILFPNGVMNQIAPQPGWLRKMFSKLKGTKSVYEET